MANIYWTGEKAPKEEAAKALMAELANYTDNRYFARVETDGSGPHLCAFVETIHTGSTFKFKWNNYPPDKFMGWRLVKIFVPINYISVILLAEEKDYD